MATTKNPSPVSAEDSYLKAERLTKAIHCLTKDRDKADMYRDIAKIYESLGDYKDSVNLAKECSLNAQKYQKLADEEQSLLEALQTSTQNNEKKSERNILRKIVLFSIVALLFIALFGAIYSKTKPGRYMRASFYEKIENYEKSYKMFHNLKSYRDSETRYQDALYQYADQCIADEKYEAAKNAYKDLGDFRNSETKLCVTEQIIMQQSKVGDNVFFGEYHWLVLDKTDSAVLLVKSLPINGFAYHNKKENVTWENSSLRSYLNNKFLNETFSEDAKDVIIKTEITVPDNKDYKTVGGNATIDKVFLLNAEQFLQYKDILSNYMRDYWLINPGAAQSMAQFVSYGEVMDYGYDVTNTNIYIRPAMWVSIK